MILEVFDSHFSWIIPPALLGKLMENQRLLLENLLSIYVGHGSGWAGGDTRSVKNLMIFQYSRIDFGRQNHAKID